MKEKNKAKQIFPISRGVQPRGKKQRVPKYPEDALMVEKFHAEMRCGNARSKSKIVEQIMLVILDITEVDDKFESTKHRILRQARKAVLNEF